MIELKNVSKFYYSKGIIASGFTKINLKFDIGEFVAITGESGSGKSTLLNVISGLDTYEEGEMYVEGKETSHYIEKDWEIYRRKYIGNIYQNFNLINSYTVYQNIDVIMTLNGVPKKERKEKILELLKKVNMLKYKNTKVSKLSGGQKQRVAIARALAKDVPVIIADEPTGSLDKKSAEEVIKLLRDISKNKLIIIVTHNYDQVEQYVTRKITMHDGKVLEDRKIEKPKEVDYSLSDYTFKNIRFHEKIKLGIRNTFNIIPKFILMMLVYSFIVASLMFEYSYFKKEEYQETKNGYNIVFNDTNDHRIVVNKNDKTPFTNEEIESLKKNKNVDYIIENDAIVDEYIEFVNDTEEMWLSTNLRPVELLDSKNIDGRLPENDNEVVIEIYKYSYLENQIDELLNNDIYMWDEFTGVINKSKSYKVVGVKHVDETIGECKMYVTKNTFSTLQYDTHKKYSTVALEFPNEYIDNIRNSGYTIEENPWVYPGTAFISEDENYRCDKFNCIDKYITITAKNMYYQEVENLRIAKTYNKKNINYIMTFPSYDATKYEEQYARKIYLHPSDYQALFNKPSYQMSIYIKDIELLDDTMNELKKLDYNPLAVKDTMIISESAKLIRALKVVTTIIFIVVLFFISYVVIKIILKSRNNYFSVIRMLGASEKVCVDLLITELLIISNLSYFIFLLISYLNNIGIMNVEFITTVNDYFKLNDYILLYVIIIIMSLILSFRYSRKIFKCSAMTAYREEI